jgi:lipopolysaccharide export system permease protein
VVLFLAIDFFDRIDNVLAEDVGALLIASYFIFKIPFIVSIMLPIAMLVATLLTIGLLSKTSELTAMRASGNTISWLARPIFFSAIIVSLFSILVNETLLPYSQRRVREIYNIDIRQKDITGGYSQYDFWWRSRNHFYSVGAFDSRTNTLHNFSRFEVDEDFNIVKRTDAPTVSWIDPILGWTMNNVTEYYFNTDTSAPDVRNFRSLPLPIPEKPLDFYDSETDPFTMSYVQLSNFIKRQREIGVSVAGYMADLHAKISFPFVIFIITLVALPFSIRSSRHGSLAVGFVSGLVIGFTYYAVHSFSISLGRAELIYPLLSAWAANILMGLVGIILIMGAESPTDN